MYLKELELHGFKSFAKKTALSFGSPIVAIVGPNGSGKSNVAEAMRFVLGEQSRDAMRAKRGEDLVWNGSKNVARLGRASVSLTFDNSHRVFDLDYPEVVLSREVHRDGTNEYSINGTRSRLRDVLELLASAHIGSSAHHVISQGETDRILVVSAKERREMIEDALGLRIYEYKISESEKKLGKTEENLKEITLLRKELAPRMQFLKKQVERVERARTLREELALAAREYFAREKSYLDHEKEAIRTGRKAPREELAEVERKVRELRERIEKGEGREDSRELLSLESRSRELRERKDVSSRKIGRIEGMIELSSSAKALEGKEERSQNDIMIPAAKVREFAGIVKGLLDDALLRVSIVDVKDTLARLKEKISGFLSSMEEKYLIRDTRYQENSHGTTLPALQKEKEEIAKEILELGREEQEVSAKIDELRKISEERALAGRDAEKELFTLLSRERDLSLALEKINQQESHISREEREWKAELGEVAILAGKEALEFEHLALGEREVGGEAEVKTEREAQKERKKKIERMKIRLEELGLGGGDDIVKEFEEVKKRDNFLTREIDDLEKSAQSLKKIIDDLHDELEKCFTDGLEKINKKFQDFFTLLFGGGTARLSLLVPQKRKIKDQDELTPNEMLELGIMPEEQERGLEISLSLPHKRLRGLQMLSGGERTLVSIALLFAVSQVNPPPFLVLDETDAALDEANSKKYADMLEDLSTTTQLMIITHNRETMSRAGIIYGITAGQDAVSKVLSIKFEDAEGMMAR